MFLNIITPCSRPQNLKKISESINIPRENYRWIVVFDFNVIPNNEYIPNNCEYYLHQNPQSTVGHAQRNFALDLINDGHIYFNDDDTVIYPDLWTNIKDLTNDFISFEQLSKDGTLRLKSNIIKEGHIDSHNFIVTKELVNDTKFIITHYGADGRFAEACFLKCKNPIHIPKPLSIYNQLR